MKITEAELRFYRTQGYLPLAGLVDGSMVEALRAEVYEVLDVVQGLSHERLSQSRETADKLRQCSQYRAGSRLDRLINGAETLSVASQLTGGPAHVYLPFTAVKAAGGGGQFHFHQDNNYTRHEPAVGSINIWVALVDMTPENGCLMVVPGSHLRGQVPSRNSDDGDTHQQIDVDVHERFPVRLRAGDAVAFTRWTVHGSGPNLTAEPRVAYALQYHREDVTYCDPQTGAWKRLLDNPRWKTLPVPRLERQA
jgi:2-oxoglutarate-dependent dioxygenase